MLPDLVFDDIMMMIGLDTGQPAQLQPGVQHVAQEDHEQCLGEPGQEECL